MCTWFNSLWPGVVVCPAPNRYSTSIISRKDCTSAMKSKPRTLSRSYQIFGLCFLDSLAQSTCRLHRDPPNRVIGQHAFRSPGNELREGL